MRLTRAKLQMEGKDLMGTIPVIGDIRLEFQNKGEYDLWLLKNSFNQILEYYKVTKVGTGLSFESSDKKYLVHTEHLILKHYCEPSVQKDLAFQEAKPVD